MREGQAPRAEGTDGRSLREPLGALPAAHASCSNHSLEWCRQSFFFLAEPPTVRAPESLPQRQRRSNQGRRRRASLHDDDRRGGIRTRSLGGTRGTRRASYHLPGTIFVSGHYPVGNDPRFTNVDSFLSHPSGVGAAVGGSLPSVVGPARVLRCRRCSRGSYWSAGSPVSALLVLPATLGRLNVASAAPKQRRRRKRLDRSHGGRGSDGRGHSGVWFAGRHERQHPARLATTRPRRAPP